MAGVEDEIAAGEQALGQLEYAAAYKHFEKVTKADASNALAWFGRAESALGLPDIEPEEILAMYKKAVELRSDDPQFLEALASFCMDMGRFNEAEQYYNKAAEVDGDNASLYWSEFGINYRAKAPIVMEKFLDDKTRDLITQKALNYVLKALNLSKDEARRILQ
ncbi:MAG TPA: tetratricopeptide repeat protein [Thermoplasmata archaeon]|nr:tetratricopeptide repeat protein [Thermoplasmata archaeon]HLA46047.1 tetratricopeptide repeat protein [Thermoplasmata archaeon]